MTRKEDTVKVQVYGCCLVKGLSNLIVGLQHVLSCAHFLQPNLLEQLLLAAAATGASLSCQATEETGAELPQRHSTSAPGGISRQHPISSLLPVNHTKFLEEVRTQLPSLDLTHSFPLGRQTWSVHCLTGILAFSFCFLAGLWLQPNKLNSYLVGKLERKMLLKYLLFSTKDI